MYIRRICRKNKDGSEVCYIQLAHNYRDKEVGHSKAKVLHSLGREEEVDREAMKRLITSINRFLGAEDVGAIKFISSKPLGGTWFLEQLWIKSGIKDVLEQSFSSLIERTIFLMVANRAMNPSSKTVTERWVKENAFIEGLTGISKKNYLEAMDCLLELEEEVQRGVLLAVVSYLNLEVGAALKALKMDLEHTTISKPPKNCNRADELLRWLVMLLIRISEHKTGDIWGNIKLQLETIHLGEFSYPSGIILQTTELTDQQKSIFQTLGLKVPPKSLPKTIGES